MNKTIERQQRTKTKSDSIWDLEMLKNRGIIRGARSAATAFESEP